MNLQQLADAVAQLTAGCLELSKAVATLEQRVAVLEAATKPQTSADATGQSGDDQPPHK